MNQEQLSGGVKQFAGKVREKWGDITNDELERFGGNVEEFTGLLIRKYGMAKEKAERELNDFLATTRKGSRKMTDTIAGYAEKGKEKLSEYAEQGKEKLSEYAEQGQQRVHEAAETVKQQTHEMADYVEKYMHEKPITTLLVAVGVGALLGAIISR